MTKEMSTKYKILIVIVDMDIVILWPLDLGIITFTLGLTMSRIHFENIFLLSST